MKEKKEGSKQRNKGLSNLIKEEEEEEEVEEFEEVGGRKEGKEKGDSAEESKVEADVEGSTCKILMMESKIGLFSVVWKGVKEGLFCFEFEATEWFSGRRLEVSEELDVEYIGSERLS